jgi:hypothetical protein
MSDSVPILQPGETAQESALRLVAAVAHSALAELLRCSVRAEPGRKITASASCRIHRQRIVVHLTHYDGPRWEPTRLGTSPAAAPILRDVEAAALAVAPLPADRPVTVKRLATLAGYRPTGHFREAVRCLVDRGLLERVRGGVRRRQNAGRSA